MAKTKTELIDSHVSLKQSKLAVDALHVHVLKKQKQTEETDLLGGKEQNIWLQITVKKMHPEKKIKPIRVPIKHPLVDPRTSAVCLISKDPQREYKDLLETHNIKFISRVVGITKLKGKFKAYEARRLLLKENGLFLADERVIPLLPGLLGRKWFDAKKQPIPVCLTRKDLKAELERAIESTYMHQNQGTCTSVKVGVSSHTPAQILENIKTALPIIAKHIKGGWENIQSLHVKSNFSTSLPIWSCDLGDDEGGRWDGLVVDEENADSTSEDEDVKKTKKAAQQPQQSTESKRTKRPLDDAAEKPKKKTKPMSASTDPIPTEPVAPVPASSPKVAKTPKKTRKASVDTLPPSQPASVEPDTIDVSVSQEEMKQKRSLESGEKKKAKIVKSKGSKSAKEKILGKKSSHA